MGDVLLDTNVVSYLSKRGDTRADLYRRHVEGKRCCVSFVTVGELYAWAAARKWSAQHVAEMEARLRAFVVIPYDVEICKAYAALWELKTSTGSPRVLADNDRWIAACALRHNLPLVTHNRRHFDGIPGLRVISEVEVLASVASKATPLIPDLLDLPPQR